MSGLRPLERVVAALGGLLLIAVVVSVAASLLRPALPLLIIIFCLVSLLQWLFGARNRW